MTHRYCTKTAQRIIKQTTSYNSPVTLACGCQTCEIPTGCQIKVGRLKVQIGDFLLTCRYISETVQDRDYETVIDFVCALSNGAISCDLE